jgi:hypothetical protein
MQGSHVSSMPAARSEQLGLLRQAGSRVKREVSLVSSRRSIQLPCEVQRQNKRAFIKTVCENPISKVSPASDG